MEMLGSLRFALLEPIEPADFRNRFLRAGICVIFFAGFSSFDPALLEKRLLRIGDIDDALTDAVTIDAVGRPCDRVRVVDRCWYEILILDLMDEDDVVARAIFL